MAHTTLSPPPSRGCPQCGGITERVARRVPDRVLDLVMPVKRYRCCAAHCGWEGLLMSRRHGLTGARPERQAASAAGTAVNRSPALMAFRARGR